MPLVAYPIVNGVTWIAFVWSIRQMMTRGDLVDGLSSGGALWFSDLTAADPTWALPLAAILLTSYQLQSSNSHATGLIHKRLKDVLQLGISLATPMILFADAGIFFYWIPGTLFKIFETRLLKSRSFRKLLKIPDAVDESLLKGEAMNLKQKSKYSSNNLTK